MAMSNKLKYAASLLLVLSATSGAFQTVGNRSLRYPPSRSSFERNSLTSVFPGVSFSRPSRLSVSSKFSFSSLDILDVQRKLSLLIQKVKESFNPVRKRILAACFALAIVFSYVGIVGAAPSSGRAGGSFKSSPRPSISRPNRSSGAWGYSRRPNAGILHSPRMTLYGTSGWHHGSSVAIASPRRMSIAEMTVLVTLAGVMIQGFVNNNKRQIAAGPLGSGATAIALIVAMNVADRGDPSSIMKRLRKLSLAADTTSRKGVQDLISEVSLELLRQEKSIISVSAKAKHFHNPELAERQFRSESVRTRSKFDREVVNKFGSQQRIDEIPMGTLSENSGPTKAVVSIIMAIEGESLASAKIRSRDDLIRTLSQVASDSQVDECLLSGEVLWSPELPGELITNEDLYADFPNLIPL